MSELPEISILTPVFNRKKFLDLMICNVMNFDYDKKKMIWIISDSHGADGMTKGVPLLSKEELVIVKRIIAPITLRYSFLNKHMSIGEKRNYLCKQANTKYLINMDSDDIYFPPYLKYSIGLLQRNKKECCGSPQMIFMYTDNNYQLSAIQCDAMRQIHEATMCFTKKHFKRMGGYETLGVGEGAKMVDGCKDTYFIKSQVANCMICLCHSENSVPKDKFLDRDCDIKVHHIDIYMKFVEQIFGKKIEELKED
jgi:hypothetical protein